ncbi:MAG: hypothetical protein JNL83_07030 [Myxococcales bacterium]|nr:hypothetical protein [Myxococcales bacterium]
MTPHALLLIGLVALGAAACRKHTTGVAACDDHLAARRACAAQLGGTLGEAQRREADRLERLWLEAGARSIVDWKTTYAPKWCRAATEDARTAFPECRW